MKLTMTPVGVKNISCIDTETTGLNKSKDRIIQLAVVKFNPETGEKLDQRDWYIKPSGYYEISEQATDVHGITKEFLEENGVKLRDIASDFIEFIEGTDILTYNGTSFDIAFIQREFERENITFDISKYKFYDSLAIERKFNSLKLIDVFTRYYGHPFEDAHNAFSDVNATIDVFNAQLKAHGDDPKFEEAVNESTTNTIISPEGFIKLVDGQLKFAVGKYKDCNVATICAKDPNYIKWLWSGSNGENTITQPTKKAIREDWEKQKESLNS